MNVLTQSRVFKTLLSNTSYLHEGRRDRQREGTEVFLWSINCVLQHTPEEVGNYSTH